MDHEQILVRERDTRIECDQSRVIPLGDLAEENVGNRWTVGT
jgi:hypothetical protein